MTAWIGAVGCIVGILFLVIGYGKWPGLIGAVLAAGIPVGAAVMSWVDTGNGFIQAGLVLILSLTATAICSAIMIWSAAWDPFLMFGAFVAIGFGSSVMALLARQKACMRPGAVDWSNLLPRVAPLPIALGSWSYGVSQISTARIGPYGLLGSANIWFFLGLGIALIGGLFELSQRHPNGWLLTTYLAALILEIYATSPLLYSIPEYAWVFKHIGIIQALGRYGRVTDPSNIYQQWPALFSAVASVSGVSKVGPLSYAAWGPLFFELANALLLLGIFRVLGANHRLAYLALFLYEGLIAWVGQDYLSPQAFGYLLWFGIVAIIARWLLLPVPSAQPTRKNMPGAIEAPRKLVARLRAPFFVQMPTPPAATRIQQIISGTLIAIIYFAIVAAHQLTPYIALAGVGGLAILGVVRRGWLLVLMMAAIAGGYLALHYGLISQQFGGIFSGGNALENASGVSATHRGAEKVTADIVRVLSVSMWLAAVVAVVYRWRRLGIVAIPALLAFSPFVILFAQNYGGEAIYRVYMFSAPWCALLIAGMLTEFRVTLWHRVMIVILCLGVLAAGLQGLYGPIEVDEFTPSELSASLWLYDHAIPHSVIILATDNFPVLETANYDSYGLQSMPSDPLVRAAWLNEGNVSAVEAWIDSLGHTYAYVVFSQSMAVYANYFGTPHGYSQLSVSVRNRPGWSVVYRSSDTVVYRIHV